MTNLSKEERIDKELTRLLKLFETVDSNQREIVTPLLENASFMKVTLEDLQELIVRDGVTETYQNGEHQKGVKQSASLQSYNALLKNYAGVVKSLSSLLPPDRKQMLTEFKRWEPRVKTEEEIEEEHEREIEHIRQLNEEFARASEWQKAQARGAK